MLSVPFQFAFGTYVTHTVLPATVGPAVNVPLFGPPHKLAVNTVSSTSLIGKHTVIGVSSGVVTIVSGTTGGSLTGVTMICIKLVSHSPPASHVITQMLSVPFQFAFGTYVTQTLLPATVGPALNVPLFGPPHRLDVKIVSSISLIGKHTVTVLSSGIVTIVSGTTGGSLTGVTMIYTIAVSQSPLLSQIS